MLVIADRVKETTTTAGVGPLTLAGAMTGFRAFSAVCSVNDTVFYAIQRVDATGAPTGEWEVGLATYSGANTLTRTTVQASSNANAAVNFAAGTKQVWLDLTATQIAGLATSASLSAYATTSYVDAGDSALSAAFAAALALKANLAGPTFTGTVTAAAETLSGLFTQAGEDGIVAFAGGGKASATPLSATKNLHRIGTCATAGDSLLMPAALAGQLHYLRHDGAAAAQLFGQGTDTINGVATGTGISIAPGMGILIGCVTNGAWTTSPVDTITATAKFLAPNGGPTTPSYSFSAFTTLGMFNAGSSFLGLVGATGIGFYVGSTYRAALIAAGFGLRSDGIYGWASGTDPSATADTLLLRAAANSVQFSPTNAIGAATARTELNKTVTAIADATPTAVLTITIPNAAHSGSVKIRVTGALGAGGAIGANEATAANEYVVTLTRTAGVNAAAAISAASGSAAAAVAGAATVTCTAALSAVSGAVGASNTFTVNVTITKSGGASANHTCLVYAQLMNANATGITIA